MYQLFVCLTFLIIGTVQANQACIYNTEVDGWLKFHPIPATYENAFLKCHYEGAMLASPLDEPLVSAIHSIMTESKVNRPIFLGTHALFSEGDFFSEEGVPLADMPIKWGAHGRGADIGVCLTMSIDGRAYYMYTSSCIERRPYICYKRQKNDTKLNGCGTFDNSYRFDQRTGSCYKLHRLPQSWSRAYEICAAEGGYLIIPNNNEEVEIIKEMFPIKYLGLARMDRTWEPMHIGLRDWNKDRTWVTIHGDKVEDVYNIWLPGQPDSIGVNFCGCILRNGAIDDVWCTYKTLFICEKDKYIPI